VARVVGYAYATRWRERPGYRLLDETTVYLAPDQGAAGIGSKVTTRPLLADLRERGVSPSWAASLYPTRRAWRSREVRIHEGGHFVDAGSSSIGGSTSATCSASSSEAPLRGPDTPFVRNRFGDSWPGTLVEASGARRPNLLWCLEPVSLAWSWDAAATSLVTRTT